MITPAVDGHMIDLSTLHANQERRCDISDLHLDDVEALTARDPALPGGDHPVPGAVPEIIRYRELCRRLTIGVGPQAGMPIVPEFAGGWASGPGCAWHGCVWCAASREDGEPHSDDCPWAEVLKEAGL